MPSKKLQIGTDTVVTVKQHEFLIEHLVDLLDESLASRTLLLSKVQKVDRLIEGFIKLSKEEQKLHRANASGEAPKPVSMVLNLIASKIEEMTTFIVSVLAPDEGIYSAIAEPDKQEIAKALSTLMNHHDEVFDHYSAIVRLVLDALLYNFAAVIVEWEEIKGTKISETPNAIGAQVEKNAVLEAGNCLVCPDVNNLFLDSAVPLDRMAEDGEFYATVSQQSKFALERQNEKGQIFLRDIDLTTEGETVYFSEPFNLRESAPSEGGLDFVSVLSAGRRESSTKNQHEIVKFKIWLDDNEFKLDASNVLKRSKKKQNYQLWDLWLLNSKQVIKASKAKTAFDKLPIAISVPSLERSHCGSKSMAEQMESLQNFASFQLNLAIRSARKKLSGGITLINSRVLPGISKGQPLEDGTYLVDNVDPDFDIRKALAQFSDVPENNDSAGNIQFTQNLMDTMFPTNSSNQIADLQRATQYQAATLSQGFNKRNLKMAKIIERQALSFCRTLQLFNIYENQDKMELTDKTGQLVEVDPSQLREAKLTFSIHAGLKGLDKTALIMHLKEILQSLLQSKDAMSRIDVVEFMNYTTSLLGDVVNLNDFKYKSQMDALSPEMKAAAFELLQQKLAEQEGGQGQAANQPQQQPQQPL